MRWRPLLLILVLAVVPFFLCLGASSLWDSNEAFYTETPREMIESGDYINPSFNYQPRFNKPPLSYWLVLAFYKVLGVSEQSERLAIVLGALVMIGVAYALGSALHSTEAGLLSAIAIAIAPRFLMFSRRIAIDVHVAMFMSLVLLFFVLSEKQETRRRLWLLLMYVAMGLGILTKGPVAGFLPALAVLIWLAATRRLSSIRGLMLPAGVLVVATVVLPWYAAIYAEHGWGYISTFLLKDNLSRYTQQGWGPQRSILFYLPVILGDMLPLSMLLPAGLWFAFRRRGSSAATMHDGSREKVERGDARLETRRWHLLLAIWIVTIVSFYSISRSKEDLYILPVYPALAALVGSILARVINGEVPTLKSFVNVMLVFMGFVLILAGSVALYLDGHGIYDLSAVIVLGVSLITGGVLAVCFALAKRPRAAVAASVLSAIIFNFTFTLRTLPDFERYKPARPFCELLSSIAPPDALIGCYRVAYPSMVFYLKRSIFEYQEIEDLTTALSSGKPVYCVLTQQEYDAMKEGLPVPTYVLASRPVFKVKLKSIGDRAEFPQVVLISNNIGANLTQ